MLKSFDWQQVLPPFSAIYGVGLAPLLILPFVFSAMVTGIGIEESQTGALITYQLIAMCAGSFLIAPFINHLPRKTIALAGACLAIVGNISVAIFPDFIVILFSMLVAGIGYGIALASGNAVIAKSEHPEKNYNQVVIMGTILMIVLLNTIPRIMSILSYQGVFGGLAAIHLLMLPGIFKLDNSIPPKQSSESKESNGLLSTASIAVIAMIFFYFVRDTMVWVYAERIGNVRLGLSTETVGMLFGAHGALSLLGPILLLLIAHRFGKLVPLLGGIIATGLITITVSQTQAVITYTLMVLIWSIGHFFTYSCMMGLASSLDSEGKIVAAAGGAVMAGNAVAPAIAGFIVEFNGYLALGSALVTAVILTAICAWLAVYYAPVEAMLKD